MCTNRMHDNDLFVQFCVILIMLLVQFQLFYHERNYISIELEIWSDNLNAQLYSVHLSPGRDV